MAGKDLSRRFIGSSSEKLLQQKKESQKKPNKELFAKSEEEKLKNSRSGSFYSVKNQSKRKADYSF